MVNDPTKTFRITTRMKQEAKQFAERVFEVMCSKTPDLTPGRLFSLHVNGKEIFPCEQFRSMTEYKEALQGNDFTIYCKPRLCGGGKRAHSSTSKAKHERDMEDKDSIMLKETKDIQLHMKGLSPQAQQDQEFIDIMNDLERVMESIRVHPTEAVITLINQLDVKSLTKMMSMVGNKNADFFYNHSGKLAFNVHTAVLARKIEDATIIMGAFFKVFRLAYFGRYMDDEGRVKHVSCVNDLSVLF